MRLGAVALLGILALACNPTAGGQATPGGSSPTARIAATQAADLRTRLDLLLGEQVMIVAKESAAAVNHSDDYAGYTALLTANSSDIADLIRRALGNTAATQLAQQWNIQNGYLVDYAIGVVTHNDAKAGGAMSGLTTGFVPQFAQLVSDASQLPLDPVTQLTTQQVLEDKAFIDDLFAQKYPAFYKDLHTAYAQTSRLGDALAVQIAHRFPDKFPGAPSAHAVDVRVSLNNLLQEHSYLATMATAAVVAGRGAEKTSSAGALASNGDMLGTVFATVFGNSTGTQFDNVWMAKDAALVSYATGDSSSREALTDTFVKAFAVLTHANRSQVAAQVAATVKVIDEQQAKSSGSLASDDRAAATSMQPIADSIQR